MNDRHLSTNARALGIRVASAMLNDEELWYWRFIAPAPASTWNGPYESAEQAYAAAVFTLVYYAQLGRRALDTMLDQHPLVVKEEEDVPAPTWWSKAFGETQDR